MGGLCCPPSWSPHGCPSKAQALGRVKPSGSVVPEPSSRNVSRQPIFSRRVALTGCVGGCEDVRRELRESLMPRGPCPGASLAHRGGLTSLRSAGQPGDLRQAWLLSAHACLCHRRGVGCGCWARVVSIPRGSAGCRLGSQRDWAARLLCPLAWPAVLRVPRHPQSPGLRTS